MRRLFISIVLGLLFILTTPLSAFAYWPALGSNPYAANAGGDLTQFVDNGTLYVAFTKNYNLTVMKKEGSSNWEVLGGAGFNDTNYDKYGEVNDPSIYVYEGVPYIAYVEHYNYTYNPTVIKYDNSTDSWDIVGNQQIIPAHDGLYYIANQQIIADENGGELDYYANYVTMYVSDSGTPYIVVNESIYDKNNQNICKVAVMEYSGTWNTVGFAGLGDYNCKGAPSVIHADGETYVAYYETDSSTFTNYLSVKHFAGLQSGPPTPEGSGWGTNIEMEVGNTDDVQLKYDDGLYLCFANTDEELEVVKRDPGTGVWSHPGAIPFDTSEEDYSMTVFDGTPYVAYMGYYDNTAHVAKYNGTDWENIYYNDYTALPANVDDLNLSSENNILYLTGTDMYGNLYTHYYNMPVNLAISQNTGGSYTISIGSESGSFSDLSKTFSLPSGLTVNLKFDAWAGFVIKSVLIDGVEIISSPCQTAITNVSTNSSHNIEVMYALASADAAPPSITTEPTDFTVNQGEPVNLTLEAIGTGDLSYQWYSNGTNSIEGGAVIEDATGSSYSPPTDMTGTTYYYCVVTNTDNSAAGNKTATTNSRIAAVTVNEIIDAEPPTITTEPADITVTQGEPANLTLEATGTGDLSYQWYRNGTKSTDGGTVIDDATGSSYSAPTDTTGTTYYYCVVTNTDNSAAGNKTATTNSRIAAVTVLGPESASIDQIISAVFEAIDNGELKGNGDPEKLADFMARLADAKLKMEAGDRIAAIKILQSIYKQIDGKPSPKDLVVGDSAAEIAQMLKNLIEELKLELDQ